VSINAICRCDFLGKKGAMRRDFNYSAIAIPANADTLHYTKLNFFLKPFFYVKQILQCCVHCLLRLHEWCLNGGG